MAPAGPITGHVDLATFAVDTTASFNVKLAKLTPHGTDLNLVGDGCTTMTPISVRMQGVVNPATGGTFASTYTIPQFQDCGLLTPVISALVSGPGNTFVASFAPHGSPPPSAPSDPGTAPPAPLATIDAHGSVTVGGTPAGATTLPIDQHVEIPGPSTPPLITATPAPAPTTTHLAGSTGPAFRPSQFHPSLLHRSPHHPWAPSVVSSAHCSGAADATRPRVVGSGAARGRARLTCVSRGRAWTRPRCRRSCS